MTTWSSFQAEKDYTDKWRTFLEEGYKEEVAFCDQADKDYEEEIISIEEFPVDRCGHPNLQPGDEDVEVYKRMAKGQSIDHQGASPEQAIADDSKGASTPPAAGAPADADDESDPAAPAQANKNKLRMAATLLATTDRLKERAPKLSDEEREGIHQLLSQWLGTMNMKLMQEIANRILQEAVPAFGVADQEVKPTRKGVMGQHQGVPEGPDLQPLDLSAVYDIIQDEETAILVAHTIAQTLERVGATVLNWKSPPASAKGAEEEGVLDKLSGMGDKLTAMVDQGMDSAAEAAEALSQGLDSEGVKNLEHALDATMLLGLTGYGEALATPAAMAALAIDIGQGDWDSALLNAIALIPVVGKAAKAGSAGMKSAKMAQGLKHAANLADKASPLVQLAKTKNIKKGLEGATKMAALLKDNYDLDVAKWAETFDKVDSTLEKLAALPVVGEDIQAKLSEFKPQIDAVREALTAVESASQGELPPAKKRKKQTNKKQTNKKPRNKKRKRKNKRKNQKASRLRNRGRQSEHLNIEQENTELISESVVDRWHKLAGINPRVL